MTTMTRTMRVLHFRHRMDEDRVVYTREPDDHTDIPSTVVIDTASWRDLGEPNMITVTIVPGDLLNEPRDG